MDFIDFLRFYKLGICFTNSMNVDYLVNTYSLRNIYKSCFPAMPFYKSDNEPLQHVIYDNSGSFKYWRR